MVGIDPVNAFEDRSIVEMEFQEVQLVSEPFRLFEFKRRIERDDMELHESGIVPVNRLLLLM